MLLTAQELTRRQQQKIRELRLGLKQSASEADRQAIVCALYCWENLS